MVAADIAVLQACIAAAFLARNALAPWLLPESAATHYIAIAAGALVLPVIWLLVGLYPGYGVQAPERLRRRVLSTAAIFVVLLGWDYLVQKNEWSRGVMLFAWGFATLALPVTGEIVIRALIRARVWGQPVLLVGPAARDRKRTRMNSSHL